MRPSKKGVIFDMDGTLVDSRLDFEVIRLALGFPPDAKLLETIAATEDESERRRLEAILHEHEMAGADCAELYPGVNELLVSLDERSIPFAVFTRNSRVVAERTLERVGLNIPLVIAREDAPPKPDPAGLHLIVSEWGIAPEEALYVGDYLYDLEAGRRAGIPTVLFTPVPPDFAHDHLDVITQLTDLEKYLSYPGTPD